LIFLEVKTKSHISDNQVFATVFGKFTDESENCTKKRY